MERKLLKRAVIFIMAISFLLCLNIQATAVEYQNPTATIDTSKGNIKIELFLDKTPETVKNFVKLANDGFYDGMIFHRIADNFMIQAGYIYPDGSIKPSPYDNIEFEYDEDALHVDGAISMASTGAGVGGSAQFFICDGRQQFLDGNYAVFGVTIQGIDVVRDIADDPHDSSSPAGGGKPYDDIIINSIIIEGFDEAMEYINGPEETEDQINLINDNISDIIHLKKLTPDSFYDYYYYQGSKPNIDVKQVTFDIINDKAVLSITVDGVIVDDNLYEYSVFYKSSEANYFFEYTNDKVMGSFITDIKSGYDVESYEAINGTITVTFNCSGSGLTDIELWGVARELTLENDTFVEHWFDYCPDESGPSSIIDGQPFFSLEDTLDTGDDGTPGFELLTLILAVLTMLFIRRKSK